METERISLIPPSMDLVEDVHAAIVESQKELSEFSPWVQNVIAEPESSMHEAIANFHSLSNELRYFIADKQSKKIIGAVGLTIRDKSVPFFEIGYWLRTSETGKELMTEAVFALENHAFTNLKARRLEIRTAETNLKSRSVAERCNYQFEDVLNDDTCSPSGERSNTVVYRKCK
ncbi:N-acetyltransferase [Parashewanella curva]|uniref:N-acetyltransferase n=1 Tax=Parashewanella curva TaxID=2338552 RepID=A0A3L8Q286_9GAMM|nr:N-acetyltransferase [Parashewanella curva]